MAARCLTRIGTRFCSSSTASTSEPLVKLEKVERVQLIGLNRPEKKNCVNNALANELYDAVNAFDQDESVDSAVIYGEGGTFCAGYDLSEMATAEKDSELMRRFTENMDRFRPIGPTRLRPSKPMIAAVHGYAVAGGMELSLMCDLRVVDETAVFGVFCRRMGVPTFNGGTVRLPKIIGLGRALDMILTGREIRAKTAMDWGLANRVVPTGTALGAALTLAMDIGKFPQLCMRSDRDSVYYAQFDAGSWDDAFTYEYKNGLSVLTKESVPGAQRFMAGIGKHGSFNTQRPPGPKRSKPIKEDNKNDNSD